MSIELFERFLTDCGKTDTEYINLHSLFSFFASCRSENI